MGTPIKVTWQTCFPFRVHLKQDALQSWRVTIKNPIGCHPMLVFNGFKDYSTAYEFAEIAATHWAGLVPHPHPPEGWVSRTEYMEPKK